MNPTRAIIADWDEEIGPIIVRSTFSPSETSSNENNPEVLVSRCYISAQSIFAKEEFSKIRFNLPMISIARLAVVLFDTIIDPSVRGGKRPFLLVMFVPIDTPYSVTDEIVLVAEPCIETYKHGSLPDLDALLEQVAAVIARGPSRGSGEDAEGLKSTFSSMLRDHFTKLTGENIEFKMHACPSCGGMIYPEEVCCTRCRSIVRTFCADCNHLVNRAVKYCPKCGRLNPKHDLALCLVPVCDAMDESTGEMDVGHVLASTGIADAVKKNETIASILDVDREDALDAESEHIRREIESLKFDLAGSGERVQKRALYETFTRDRGGYRVGDKTIADQLFEISLKEPAVDEVDLVIKSMGVVPDVRKVLPASTGSLVTWWPCEAFAHARGRVIAGLGSSPKNVKGVAGVLLVTETAIFFVSYQPSAAPGIENLFTYFDASIKHASATRFQPGIHENAITFSPHGTFVPMFGDISPVSLHFSWSTDPDRETWEYQAFTLQSTIDKLVTFTRLATFPVGKAFSMAGKQPGDPAVRNVLVDLVSSKTIAAVLRDALPGLGM